MNDFGAVGTETVMDHPSARAVARFLPGIVAAVLALVYVVGSMNAAGAFSREGLSVTVVRLLSLEQILVRGVSVVTQPELLLCAVIWLIVMGLLFRIAAKRLAAAQALADDPGVPDEVLHRRARRARRIGLLLIWLPLLSLLAMPWRVGVLVLGMGILFCLVILVLPNPESSERLRAQFYTAFAIAVAVVYLAANFLIPLRQPTVEMTVEGLSHPVEGVYITKVDATWYIAVDEEGSGRSVQSFSDAAVVDVAMRYPSQGLERPLISYLL